MTSTMYNEINNKLDILISSNLSNKKALNLSEAAQYIGISKTYMYQLTHRREIPFYKPNGKQVYFDKNELDNWLLSNPKDNVKEQAKEYIKNLRGVK